MAEQSLAQCLELSSYTSYVHSLQRSFLSRSIDSHLGILCLLRFPSLPPPARKPPRRDNPVMMMSRTSFGPGKANGVNT
jgi:hypothetical protein